VVFSLEKNVAYLSLLCCLLVAGGTPPLVQRTSPVPDSTERNERDSSWSDPRRLWPEAGHPLFGINLAVTDTAVFVAGNGNTDPKYRIGVASRPDSMEEIFDDTTRLRVRQIGGPELSVPPGGYEMTDPFLAATPDGLHLVWSEPQLDSLRKVQDTSVRGVYTKVYHSRYADGHWTSPTPVVPPGWVESFRDPADGTGALCAGPEGALHFTRTILLSSTEELSNGGLYSRWVPRQKTWRGPSFPEFQRIGEKYPEWDDPVGVVIVDVTTRPSGDAHLAVVAGLPGNPNSVLAARRPAERAEWTSSKVLWYSNDPESTRFDADGQGVTDLTLLSDSSGTLYLLREQSLDQGISPEVARLVVSHDGGQSWSEPFDFPLSDHFKGGFFGVVSHHAAVTPSGRLHAVFLGRGENGQVFYHARWSATEGWGAPLRVNDPETHVSRPDLAVGPDGEQLHLVYTRGGNRGPPEAVHRTFPLR